MRAQPEARRHAVLEDLEDNEPGNGCDLMRLVMVMVIMRVTAMAMPMSVVVMCRRSSSHALATFTARPRQAIGIASREMDRRRDRKCD